MKAIVLTEYGTPDVLQLKEVEKPTPKDNEILIKVHATTATTADCELRSFKTKLWLWLPLRIFMGISKPRGTKILGQEVAGEVESVGKNVRSFKKGDQVFGLTGMGFGAYAEYKCLHEKSTVTTKPANATYAEAAPFLLGEVPRCISLGRETSKAEITFSSTGLPAASARSQCR
jgi:NADPH:quinone reductase-like Zn-dependent oxidoreductase